MPKLYSLDEIIKALLKIVFNLSHRGAVIKSNRKTGTPTLIVIVPADRKQIPPGTFKSLVRQ
jgi:predicted RNA binding protein YcfA (HicA-like mRNA interferase family)